MTTPSIPLFRQETLRDALQGCVDALHHRRARDIPEDFIDDFVSLHWLEWHGGSLRLTITGENICRQVRG
jgi:hypothetical protein